MIHNISFTFIETKEEFLELLEPSILQFVEQNFKFDTVNFDSFYVVLTCFNKDKLDEFGDLRIQISKKERAIFLGANLFNEILMSQEISIEEKLNYCFQEINKSKDLFFKKLIANGMILINYT